MIELSDLTTEELQYLRSKWNSEQTEFVNERARKVERLNNRLESQEDDAGIQEGLEAELAHAQSVYDVLVANNADQALIDSQQAVIDNLQAQIDQASFSSGYISHTDALRQQLEFDELAYAATRRGERIAEIDALL